MGDYDAPPSERIENVRAERDAAQRATTAAIEDALSARADLAETRAAFAADLARAEAEHERLASAARSVVATYRTGGTATPLPAAVERLSDELDTTERRTGD